MTRINQSLAKINPTPPCQPLSTFGRPPPLADKDIGLSPPLTPDFIDYIIFPYLARA